MSSQCTSDGSVSLTITFQLGTDLDTAQVLVQNRVAIAEPRLPEEVRQIGVTTRKSSPDLLLVIHMVSPSGRYDQLYISNYALLQVRDVLARVDGVGDVTLFGARDYSMRVWLDPDRIAELGMTAGDVVAALREQNVQVAAGVIGQPPAPPGTAYQLTVSTLGRLAEAGEFANIVIRTGADGRITRLARRGARRARRARLLGQQLPLGRAGRGDGDRAAARLERARHRGAHPRGDGGALAVLPGGARVQDRLRPDPVRRRVDPRRDHDALRGGRARRDRRARLPAELARERDPARRDPGLADRDVRRDGGARLLAQQPLALRPRARDRHRGRRRDRRRRERRARALGGPRAASRPRGARCPR